MLKFTFDLDMPADRLTARELYELIVTAIVDAQTASHQVVDPQARRADAIAKALEARRLIVG